MTGSHSMIWSSIECNSFDGWIASQGTSGLDFVLSVNIRIMVQRSSAMASNGIQQDNAGEAASGTPWRGTK